MSVSITSGSVTSNLMFQIDTSNGRSFTGAPATTLIPGGDANGFPTDGNTWGTYNDRLYNAGSTFTLGIASVSGNLVTTTAPHNFVTYDAMRPQSTGGGLTSGVPYYLRVWSSTTFSLHTYVSDNSGVNGMKSLDVVDQDVRVPINATSFPTSWRPTEHFPNTAGFGKELIRNGFKFKQRIHDCLRNHYLHTANGIGRPYMAYGINPTLTSGVTYTLSFYHKAATPSLIGMSIQFSTYTNGSSSSQNFTLGAKWQKFTHTFTPTATGTFNPYWAPTALTLGAWDIAEISMVQGTTSPEYTSGTRAATDVFRDLMGNSTITASSLVYDSAGSPSFNGTSSSLSCTSIGSMSQYSIGVWVKMNVVSGEQRIFSSSGSGTFTIRYSAGQQFTFHYNPLSGSPASDATSVSGTFATGIWRYVVATNTPSGTKFYVDGALQGSGQAAVDFPANPFFFGSNIGTSLFSNCTIGLAQIYNKELSAAEVRLNFNAQRARFGV